MDKNILLVVGIIILFLGTCVTSSIAIDNFENDIYSDEKSSIKGEFRFCIVGLSGDGTISHNYNFAFRKDITFDLIHGHVNIYPIFTDKFYNFNFEFLTGELKYFTGIMYTDFYYHDFSLAGYARIVSIEGI